MLPYRINDVLHSILLCMPAAKQCDLPARLYLCQASCFRNQSGTRILVRNCKSPMACNDGVQFDDAGRVLHMQICDGVGKYWHRRCKQRQVLFGYKMTIHTQASSPTIEISPVFQSLACRVTQLYTTHTQVHTKSLSIIFRTFWHLNLKPRVW